MIDKKVQSVLLWILVVILGTVTLTTALQCYSCFGTGGNNECEKYDTYKDAKEGKRPELMKNCSMLYNDVCAIETFATLGNTVSHIRDCSDGRTFSFNASERQVYKRLTDLQYNNETACVWDGQNLVCLTLCDEDFCNGPIMDEVSGGARIAINMAALLCGFLSYVITV